MGGFYGTVITAKKATPYVPRALEAGEPPEGLHVTGFSIPADCKLKDRARVSVMLKQGDEPAICVCTLCVGGNDSMLVSITLEEYVELSLVGPAAAVVHMHGAFVPHEGGVEDEEDEEADSDDENLTAAQMMEKQLNQLIGQPSGLGGAQGGGGGGAGDESDDDESDDESEDEEEEAEGEGAELATDEKIVTRFSGSKHVEITVRALKLAHVPPACPLQRAREGTLRHAVHFRTPRLRLRYPWQEQLAHSSGFCGLAITAVRSAGPARSHFWAL